MSTSRIVRAGAGRRRLQTAVLVATALVSVAASVLGLGLLVASDAPFDRASADRNGAHLRLDFDAAAVTRSDLAATAEIPGVTAAAGPFPLTTVPVTMGENARPGPDSGPPTGTDLGLLTVVGRGGPGAAVDEIALSAGRWPTGPGEIVLNTRGDIPAGVGSRLAASSPAGRVTLTVVGLAGSVTDSAGGWAIPQTVTDLAGSGRPPDYQMLYRFAEAGTPQQLSADRAAIVGALPDGAVIGAQSYLAIRQQLTANSAAFVPFVIAFGVIALVMSVLVIGIVVSGTVGSASRRIGICKALGYTPWQVAGSYVRQALVPTGIGMVLGAGAAVVVAQPVLGEIEQTYGSADVGIPVWVVLVVILAALALVALAALLPALRIAGRRTVDVLRAGRRTSAGGRGRGMQRLLAAAPLPRPLTLGLAGPVRRPARSAAMAATVLAGTVCLTFAVGLMSSLSAVQHSRDPLSGAAVQVGARLDFEPFPGEPGGSGPQHEPGTPDAPDPDAWAAAIRAMPGTRGILGLTDIQAVASGLAGSTTVVGLSGDGSFTAHQMVAGHWLTGAGGEAVLPTRALREAGISVGDRLTLSLGGRSTTVTVVGEVFDLTHEGLRVYTDDSALDALGADGAAQSFLVEVDPGTNLDGYLDSLNARLAPLGGEAYSARDGSSSVLVTMNAVAALLAAMLLLVAGIGVLNTVVLETRERARDIGVFKSLGMTPRQAVLMVLASVSVTGLVAGAIGVPLGVLLHHVVVPVMGSAAGSMLTPGQVAVYGAPVIAGLLLGGLVIAALGALAPAGWAARSSSAAALRSE